MASTPAGGTTPRPRNILFITSDQQRGDCFGFEGRKVKTPHLDLLARQGTRFSSCITPSNVCQPSRASILTGLLPMNHRVWDNGIDLDPAIGAAGFGGRFARDDVAEPTEQVAGLDQRAEQDQRDQHDAIRVGQQVHQFPLGVETGEGWQAAEHGDEGDEGEDEQQHEHGHGPLI